MADTTEMVYERFEDALKSLKFQCILQWMKASKVSTSIFFSIFEKRKEYQNEEPRGGEADLRLFTADENLTGKTPFHFALEARKLDETLFEDMVKYVSDQNHEENLSHNLRRPPSPIWDLKDSTGRTLFEKAVILDDVISLMKMSSLGAEPEKMKVMLPDDSQTLTNILGLSVACASNRVFRHILQAFECCNTWDICGRRPIHISVRFGNLEALQTLLEKDLEEVSSKIVQHNQVEIFRTRENFSIQYFTKTCRVSNDDERNFDNGSDSDSNLDEVESIRSDSISPRDAENESRSHESMNVFIQTSSSEYEEEDLFMFDDLAIIDGAIEDTDLVIDNEEEGNEIMTLEGHEDTEYGKSSLTQEEHDSNLFHIAVDYNQCKIIQFLLKSAYMQTQLHQRRADGMTPLHIAAKRNNQEILELLVKEGGANLNLENDLNGAKALHVACENGAAECALFLLRNGCDANSEDEDGLTPIHYASKNKRGAQCIDLLTHLGAKIDSLSSEEETPVYRAISRWNLDGFWKLLEHGGDPSIPHSDGTIVLGFLAANSLKELARFINFCRGRTFAKTIDLDAVVAEEGKTSLHLAVNNLSVDAVKALVSAGASILQCDENGVTPFAEAINIHNCSPQVHQEILVALLSGKPDITSHNFLNLYPLHFASKMRFHKLMQRLLDHGIEVNMQKDSMTPLHFTAEASDVIGMQILLSGGADWKISDKDGCSPLLVCAHEHFVKGIEILVSCGASISDTNNNNENGMHISSLKRSPNVFVTLEYFAVEKSLIEMMDSSGDKPIHAHVRKGRIEGVRSLVRLGCDVNGLSGNNETPLMIACEAGNIPAIRILLRSGADVNITNRNGHTAMYFFSGDEKVSSCVLRLLLNSRCFMNRRDKDGDTILHEAVIGNHARITRLLVKRGIDVNLRNNEGETALFIACKLGFSNIVQILLSQRSYGQLCDLNVVNNDGVSAYQAARSEGHTDIVTNLLKAMNISLSKFAPKSLFIRSRERKEELPKSFRELKTSEMCIVCQEEFKEGDFIRKFPCIHEFHNDCILPWIGGEEMEKSIKCPICKQPLVPDRI